MNEESETPGFRINPGTQLVTMCAKRVRIVSGVLRRMRTIEVARIDRIVDRARIVPRSFGPADTDMMPVSETVSLRLVFERIELNTVRRVPCGRRR